MASLIRCIESLAFINQKLAFIFRHLSWIFLALMTLFIVLQVFFRYVLNSSLGWSEDVSLLMMIWIAFACAPIAYRNGANVALDTLLQLLRGRLGFLMQLLIHCLLLALITALLIEAVELIGRSRIRANTLPIQMKYIYMIMPVSFVSMLLVGVELVLRCSAGLIQPDSSAAKMPQASGSAAQHAQ
jgi:TRAP-type C4-dicarboxylate transport system permease small subunit